jgi:hypothetical protein
LSIPQKTEMSKKKMRASLHRLCLALYNKAINRRCSEHFESSEESI